MSAERRPGAAVYPKSPLGESDARIPTGRDVEWEPLVDYRRNGVSETTIHGAIAWATGPADLSSRGRLVHSFGGNVLCYGRSMMKPLMAKPLAAVLGPVLSPEQKAIAVASHNGAAAGFDLRNPYALNRQKAFLVPGIVPPAYLARLEAVPTWDEWDPDRDRWLYDFQRYEGTFGGAP